MAGLEWQMPPAGAASELTTAGTLALYRVWYLIEGRNLIYVLCLPL